MNNELKIRDFVISIVYAYLLVFAVAAPLVSRVSSPDGLEDGLVFGVFTVVFGGPVAILAVLFGYPVFRLVFERIRFGYFLSVMISCLVTASVVAVLAAFGFVMLFGGHPQEVGNAIVFIGVPTMVVAFFSGLLFWNRTR